MSEISPALRQQLIKYLESKYTLDDLKTLCFDLGADYPAQRDISVRELSTSLLTQCQAEDKTTVLLREIMLSKPKDSDFLQQLMSKLPPSGKWTTVAIEFEKPHYLWGSSDQQMDEVIKKLSHFVATASLKKAGEEGLEFSEEQIAEFTEQLASIIKNRQQSYLLIDGADEVNKRDLSEEEIAQLRKLLSRLLKTPPENVRYIMIETKGGAEK